MQSLIDYIEQIVHLDEVAIEALHRLAEVEHFKIQTANHLYQLEINSMDDELKTTYLEPSFKSITLMRWIRKGMADGSFIQLQ